MARQSSYFTFLCALFDDLVERFIVSRTTVRISGTILLNCPNENPFSPDNLSPAYCDGQKMSIAEGDIGHGNVLTQGMALGHGDVGVG